MLIKSTSGNKINYKTGMCFMLVIAISYGLSRYVFIGVNVSSSFPESLFIIYKNKSFKKNDFVAFRHKNSKFFSPNTIFVKKIVGVAGDTVYRVGEYMFVNNIRIGKMKLHSIKGLILRPGPVGRLPKNNYFVASPHQHSFDSRYAEMGWIKDNEIIGSAKPIY